MEPTSKSKNITAFLYKKLKQRTSQKPPSRWFFFWSLHQQACLPAREGPFAQGIAQNTCEPAEPEEEFAVSGLSRYEQS